MTTNPERMKTIMGALGEDVNGRLQAIRARVKHAPSKGSASEDAWIDLFNEYLPARYKASGAFVVDSQAQFSEQIDLVIYDRHYTPFVLKQGEHLYIPAESVYAVFEIKQTLNASHVGYSAGKIASVRGLQRTSLPVPNIYGEAKAKPLHEIIGGILTSDSDWKPSFSDVALNNLASEIEDRRIHTACVATTGSCFWNASTNSFEVLSGGASRFLFELISKLQSLATAPMIDTGAYARWLD